MPPRYRLSQNLHLLQCDVGYSLLGDLAGCIHARPRKSKSTNGKRGSNNTDFNQHFRC